MTSTSTPSPSINPSIFRNMIEEGGQIGLDPSKGPGLHRLAFSPLDFKGREWVVQQMKKNGLEVYIDGAMNIHGFLRAGGDESEVCKPSLEKKRVVTGSHFDTVIGGGRLDGGLGVIAGIHSLGRIKEMVDRGEVVLERSLEVIDFTDEEGRFGGMMGSMCIAGKLEKEKMMNMKSADSGERLATLLGKATEKEEEAAVEGALKSNYPQGSIHSYVELHIEQGPVLDIKGEQLGVVSGICGLWKMEFTLLGQANHAGTTPMSMRRNAFEGVAHVQVAIPSLIKEGGSEHTVCTIGSVNVFPGSPNVVPGKCVFTVEVRDIEQNVVNTMAQAVIDKIDSIACELNLVVEKKRLMSNMPPIQADKRIMNVIKRECDRVNGGEVRIMPSGAAHDAQQIGAIAPMGMIFVPSIGGVSHDVIEDTKMEDLEKGCEVLVKVLLSLAVQEEGKEERIEEEQKHPQEQVPQQQQQQQQQQHKQQKPTSHTALLCIDLQDMPPTTTRPDVDFTPQQVQHYNNNISFVLERVKTAQEKARELGLEVIHCRIESVTKDGRERSALHKRMNIHVPPGTAKWLEGIEPKEGELIMNKTGSDVFSCTNLDYILRNIGIKRLICCGVLTEECVGAAVKTAVDIGYDCVVLSDACLTGCEVRQEAAMRTFKRLASVTTTEEWLGSAEEELVL